MKRIPSFCVDHTKLQPGIYTSRIDDDIVTYDIRMKKPNVPPFLPTASMHTIEHLFATISRNSEYEHKIIYFGPMGCRTGFYLILSGEYQSRDILPLMKEMFAFIAGYEGDVPGASARDCGNYLDMNLPMANYLARKYLDEVLESITEDQLHYPE